ncbi:CRISPR-associated helicase Cas3' [Peptoniphilus sp. MSJ-1]|uniref:CRISPR-associated helicase Cas3 n=1 Tax=Peptoniphilus ovalis TaxID=2841503 RepID=A0ABS6FE32_9FIRM|nr:CRISPR-associated helicase Cas3' [Peptoniphilus ovalis]MBU5668427.1 CRISPR-associated helicase Cas3' [Peptoniphilus ovalis]
MKISEIICDHKKYYGHINQKNKTMELLDNHIELVDDYYKNLKKEKNLDEVFKRIFEKLEINPEYFEIFKELADSLVSAHDWGKINSKFQSERLFNKIEDIDLGISSKHSILSAALYLYYYLDYLDNLSLIKADLQKIQYILFLNAYIISKHHSDLDNFEYSGKSFWDYFSINNNDLEIFKIISETGIFTKDFSSGFEGKIKNFFKTNYNLLTSSKIGKFKKEKSKTLFIYQRLMYSLLVASDFYATTEFMNSYKSQKEEIDKESLIDIYNNSNLMKSIRNQEETKSYKKKEKLNDLRTKIFLEVEENFEKNKDKNIYFLESPTGSGKSNIAINLSYKLLDENMNKIIYAYPFNTLVEQNRETLREYYKDSEVGGQISVLNSVTEIGNNLNEEEGSIEQKNYYIKVLQDRQFLHSPFILTSNVALFEIIFSSKRSSIFGLYQLTNSVIVLDEIQAYKEKIWNEIIEMLSEYAEILNMKIIIMSATLPDLSKLLDENNKNKVAKLIDNPREIFNEDLFKNRVKLNYELLDRGKVEYVDILDHLKDNIKDYKKILLEFIKKDDAENFYDMVSEDKFFADYKVFILTGADNSRKKKDVVEEIKTSKEKLILIATQVIEAGVDIDMDIGYKDISKLENEEQFLGRINRSAKKSNSVAYFFDMADESVIYGHIDNELTLRDKNRRKNLEEKDFEEYFNLKIEKAIEDQKSLNYSKYKKALSENKFLDISNHMKLIDKIEEVNIFANQIIELDGKEVVGEKVWKDYKKLLQDYKMDYSRKIVELSKIKVIMSNFMYKISKVKFEDCIKNYNDFIGNIYYLDDGEKYLKNGRIKLSKDDTFDDLFI